MFKIEEKNTKERNKDYVINMRKKLSSKTSILENGELNHVYFQTKLGQYWSNKEFDLLKKGIEEFGLGNWSKISKKYLKDAVTI